MKRKDSTVALTCIAFFLLFLVFQVINLSPVSTPNTQGRLELKAMRKKTQDPPSQTLSSRGSIISCDRSRYSHDLCSINGPNVLDPTVSTFFDLDPPISAQERPMVEKTRPYPRKWENFTMSRIKEITLASGPPSPRCEIRHEVPALVFATGGYTGNFFHDFNDGFIPLFVTVNTIFPDHQNFVLVISKARDWWVNKYVEILHAFSPHPIINLDNDAATHCFPSTHVGLVSHGFMTIDPRLTPNSKTFAHFRSFLAKAYDRTLISNQPRTRPRLILASRSGGGGRVILNQNEVVRVMEKVGFEVVVFEPKHSTRLRESYALINSSHAMVGVHGAALTHSLFLRPQAVFMQVVPLGDEWVSNVCFGASARAMGLEYMEYRINAKESSLMEKYGENNVIVRDPKTFKGEGWSHKAMTVYLKEQDVKLDLARLRAYLEGVYKKAKRFMDKEG